VHAHAAAAGDVHEGVRARELLVCSACVVVDVDVGVERQAAEDAPCAGPRRRAGGGGASWPFRLTCSS
jgi:hypothetical protein